MLLDQDAAEDASATRDGTSAAGAAAAAASDATAAEIPQVGGQLSRVCNGLLWPVFTADCARLEVCRAGWNLGLGSACSCCRSPGICQLPSSEPKFDELSGGLPAVMYLLALESCEDSHLPDQIATAEELHCLTA